MKKITISLKIEDTSSLFAMYISLVHKFAYRLVQVGLHFGTETDSLEILNKAFTHDRNKTKEVHIKKGFIYFI